MGQCVSRKAGAVIAASGHHDSPSYRIMEKSAKIQVKAPRFYSFCFSLFFQTIIKIFQYRITMMYILTINNRKLIINFFLLPLESFLLSYNHSPPFPFTISLPIVSLSLSRLFCWPQIAFVDSTRGFLIHCFRTFRSRSVKGSFYWTYRFFVPVLSRVPNCALVLPLK